MACGIVPVGGECLLLSGARAPIGISTAAREIQELLAICEAVAQQSGASAGQIPKLSAPSILEMLIEEADIVARITQRGVVLDWGCGFGQLASLLSRRGLRLVGADLSADEDGPPRLLLLDRNIHLPR